MIKIEKPKYGARVLEVVKHPGCWDTVRMGVFEGETKIGEYDRNYPAFGPETFFPFEQDGVWYALYSKEYTATRLMRLPECEDSGGEEPASFGFCPTGYLVPELCGQEIRADDPEPRVANHDHEKWAVKVPAEGGGTRWYWPDAKDHPSPDEARKAEYLAEKARSHAAHAAWMERNPFATKFARWGLVMGCVWGDDSGNWKVEYLDLSRAKEGILVREARFGYLQLGPGATLKTGVDTDRIDDLNAPPEEQYITIAVPARFNLAGKRLAED